MSPSQTSSEFLQLSVYVDETDTVGEQPLYEVIIRYLLQHQIAGATAVRGLMGFGQHAKLHHRHLFGVADDRPVMVVAVDESAKIRAVQAGIRGLVKEGLVTISPVEVIQ